LVLEKAQGLAFNQSMALSSFAVAIEAQRGSMAFRMDAASSRSPYAVRQ
jgi:hypothetical protein